MLFTYLVSAIAFVPQVLKKGIIKKKMLFYSAIAAGGSITGIYFTILSLKHLSGNIVFPVYFTGYTTVSVVVSFLYFKEKISPLGLLGIASGLSGIIILCIK